ncbi:unnamed protein product [Soboliphyme baturini]|uniref:LEM domain-containing protein n=1 Tax=Soboliphyme baturini TaxID=241478 RepID=A0A183J1N4_9BILA|nr:unnamed protein product [Soboliphyme baturini]
MNQMTDDDLRKELRRLGVNFGPITDTTRSFYYNKIAKLKENQNTPTTNKPEPPRRTTRGTAVKSYSKTIPSEQYSDEDLFGRRSTEGDSFDESPDLGRPSAVIPGEANIHSASSSPPSQDRRGKSLRLSDDTFPDVVPGVANLLNSGSATFRTSHDMAKPLVVNERVADTRSTSSKLWSSSDQSTTDGFMPKAFGIGSQTKPSVLNSTNIRDSIATDSLPYSVKTDDLVRRRLHTDSSSSYGIGSGGYGFGKSAASRPKTVTQNKPAGFGIGSDRKGLVSALPSSLAPDYKFDTPYSRRTIGGEPDKSLFYHYNGVAEPFYDSNASKRRPVLSSVARGLVSRRPVGSFQSTAMAWWRQSWVQNIKFSKYFSEHTPRHVIMLLSVFFALLTIAYFIVVHTGKLKIGARIVEGALADTVSFVYGQMILPLLIIAAVAAVVGLLYLFRKYQLERQQMECKKIFALVEKIIETVRERHEESELNKNIVPYIAIPRVRDMLISPYNRLELMPVWEKAVRYLNENESRVRAEVHSINGEEVMVWRWLQTGDDKIWQGHAFPEDQKALNLPILPYFECLKLRGLFEPELESEDDWSEHIRDAILEKLGDSIHVVHLFVDGNSKEGCVYLRLRTREEAGEAYKRLHGYWFNGKPSMAVQLIFT